MTNVNHIILQYKAHLFDLFKVKGQKQITNQWMDMISELIQVEGCSFYFFGGENFELYRDINLKDAPSSITQQQLQSFLEPGEKWTYDENKGPFHMVFLFETKEKNPLILVGFTLPEKNGLSQEVAGELHRLTEKFINQWITSTGVIDEGNRYQELFKVTEIFHSNRDVNKLLAQVIGTLFRVFPDYTFSVLLSNDNYEHGDLPIKNFDFERANEASMKAFVSGSIEVDKCLDTRDILLYAPLKGKQGIYGVLEVNTNNPSSSYENQLEFIRLLAYTAGSALENAKLYEQSRRLITDLQLINETSHKLNLNLRMSETLVFLKNQIKRSFQASSIGFVFKQENQFAILDESSSFFKLEEARDIIDYVEERIQQEKDSIFIGDLSSKLTEPNYLSLMAIPMIQHNELIGFCIVAHEEPYMFTFDMYKLLQSFIHHSTLAITNAMLREKLEKLVITDHMTQLYARNYLDDEMDKSMQQDQSGVFIILDIDNFKSVNDTYGHQVGDEVIIQVSNLMKKIVGDKGFVARWGGEELAAYFPELALEEGIHIANEMVRLSPTSTSPMVTISCGVSAWNRMESFDNESVNTLVQRADKALYAAKNTGKNKVSIQNNINS